MKKLHVGIFSDLHLDHAGYFKGPRHDVDLYLNAGDTGESFALRNGFIESWAPEKTFTIMGNHDYYRLPKIGDPEEYMFLKDFNGLKIAGATLWTDLTNPMDWLYYANGMTDMELMGPIGWGHEVYMHHHKTHRDFLFNSGADIIISHHLPSYLSVAPRWKNDALNPCFATEFHNQILDMKKPPKLWVHGHTHSDFDYMIGNTRVICHPRGYPYENDRKLYKNYSSMVVQI